MKLWVLVVLLPACIDAGLFHALVKEECTFDRECSAYQCTKIKKQFPPMYYENYQLNCLFCDLKVFDRNTFPHTNSLLSFNVTNSNMENITSYAFENLNNLQHVHLEHNKIVNISANAFAGMRHVYELHLEYNYLEEFTEGFLNRFEANTIYFNNNRLRTITPGVFKGMYGVMTVDFSHNSLTTLEKDSLSNLNGIETLNLGYNQLCSLPYGTFQHLETLRHLDLSNNKFKVFPTGIFSPVKHLTFLNISHNYLMEIDTSILLPMARLSMLDISANGLEYLDTVSLYKNVPTLRHLSINDNLWTCPNLASVVQYLKSVKVDVSGYTYKRYDITNINGIACSTFQPEEKMQPNKYLELVAAYSAQYQC